MKTVSTQDVYPSRVHHEPQWLERQDPVVHTDGGNASGLTDQQIRDYDEKGYLFIEDFFSAEELTQYRAEMNRLWRNSQSAERDEVIREPSSQEVRSIFAVHRDSPVFGDLSKHPKLRQAVEHILGGSVYVHQSRINFKPGFTGKEFYWHSDFETWHVEDGMPRMRALSCSIALEDNYHYNGPLMVVPGSHKQYVTCVGRTPDDHFKQSLRRQEYGVPDPASITKLVEEGGIDTPVGRAGSIVFFDCNIMHGSNSNITPKPRSNVFLVFNSVENKLVEPFSGQKPRPAYIAERG